MNHIVFVDANAAGIYAVSRAVERNLTVSFIRSRMFGSIYGGPHTDAILAQVKYLIEIDDPTNGDELLEAVQHLHSSCPVDGMCATFEFLVLPVAKVADHLGILFTPLPAVVACTKKAEARRILQRANLEPVQFSLVQNRFDAASAADVIGFPVVAKPNTSTASKLVGIIKTREELLSYFDSFKLRKDSESDAFMRACLSDEILLEELLIGRMMSVEVAADSTHAMVITINERKRDTSDQSLELGTTMPAAITATEWATLTEYSLSVVDALGLRVGIFHLEVMLTARGPRLIEANPRMIGGGGRVFIQSCYGFDAFDLLIDLHLGGDLPASFPSALRYTTGHHIAAAKDTVSRKVIDVKRLENDFGKHLVYLLVKDFVGKPVRRYSSNFDSLGMVLMWGDDAEESETRCNSALARIENDAGFELMGVEHPSRTATL